jgi:hypothetical protein
MLDCMMAYESDFRTYMDLSDGNAPLPCPEQIWDEPVLNKSQILLLHSGSSFNQAIVFEHSD